MARHGLSVIRKAIGVYDIQSHLGSGGMGEVYRARDTKLGREVAIKILPEAFSRDAESLNHPNIGAIYGFEDADDLRALVLELVEGDTVADRLRRGPLPISEALAAARQIAGALDAAHQRGIVHRDLKPANIKIKPDGAVKVLDFCLATTIAVDPISGAPGAHYHCTQRV